MIGIKHLKLFQKYSVSCGWTRPNELKHLHLPILIKKQIIQTKKETRMEKYGHIYPQFYISYTSYTSSTSTGNIHELACVTHWVMYSCLNMDVPSEY